MTLCGLSALRNFYETLAYPFGYRRRRNEQLRSEAYDAFRTYIVWGTGCADIPTPEDDHNTLDILLQRHSSKLPHAEVVTIAKTAAAAAHRKLLLSEERDVLSIYMGALAPKQFEQMQSVLTRRVQSLYNLVV